MKWTEFRLYELIQKRYPEGRCATFRTVYETTGYDSGHIADAISMGLWPSRGLDIHGFELKVSRADWLKELKKPEKAEGIAKYCDYWWLVISNPDYVKDGELPNKWGMLVPHRGKLSTIKKAKRLEPVPLDRNFVASLLRRAHEQTEKQFKDYIPRSEIKNELDKARKAGEKVRKNKARLNLYAEQTELEQLKTMIDKFEQESGVSLTRYNAGRIGKAVKYVLAASSAAHAVRAVDRSLAILEKTTQKIRTELQLLKEEPEPDDGWED